jgi:hypothetical protein
MMIDRGRGCQPLCLCLGGGWYCVGWGVMAVGAGWMVEMVDFGGWCNVSRETFHLTATRSLPVAACRDWLPPTRFHVKHWGWKVVAGVEGGRHGEVGDGAGWVGRWGIWECVLNFTIWGLGVEGSKDGKGEGWGTFPWC